MKNLILSSLVLISSINLFAQTDWQKGMFNPNADFYQTQTEFNNYWDGREVEKGKGWKQFKRWESFMEPRVNADGTFPSGKLYKEWVKLRSSESISKSASSAAASWSALGPTDVPYSSSGEKRGVGRINTVEFDPNDPNTIWVGSPSGGLWKSIDGGLNWNTNTDLLPNLGVSDIAINPTNTNIMYIATGDRDAGDTYSYGILKSVDGGITWDTTGLSFSVNQSYRANRILINPNNPDVLIVSTREGTYGNIYRSTDGGDSWNITQSNVNMISMEFKPNDPNVIYGATNASPNSARFWKSIDNGQSWSLITNGLPLSGVSRGHVAVTNDNSDVVYLLFSASDNGFYGVYKSTDSGDNWVQQSNSPNLLGWSTDGSDSGGQGWYDLALAVNPLNENEIFVGGVNVWKSTNGGSSWFMSSHWYGGGGNEYMHADEHILKYNTANNKLYSGNDGGLYNSLDNGTTWTDISDDLQITQFYRFSVAQTDSSIVLAGAQDNGTKRMTGAHNWDAVRGGDGMECIIDHSDANIMYSTIYYGAIDKSTDGGNSWFDIAPASNGAWVTPYIMDQSNSDILYAGYEELYKSINGGTSWNQISSGQTSGGTINALAVSKSNSNYIYMSDDYDIWGSIDGGSTWTNIGAGVPNSYISYISVHPTNPQKVWVSLSGYSNNAKVYYSSDAGATWTNMSWNLPNIPANCIIYNHLSPDDELFIATDLGVFYTNNLLPGSWQSYNQGMPNVIVNELEIHQNSNSLFAATYGRGVWKTPLPITAPPIADFSTTDTLFCTVPAEVNFNNFSTGATNFVWNFGDGNSSNSTNPTHSYSTFGDFTVELIASGPLGIDTVIYSQIISVSPSNPCSQNMPSTSTASVFTDCSGLLYDDGGPNSNYSDNHNSYVTIAPTGATQITLNFLDFGVEAPSSATSCNYDYLEIFDGLDTNATSLGQYCNTLTGSPGIITSSGNGLTLKLHSDANTSDIGIEALWNCSYPSAAPITDFSIALINSCNGDVQFVDESIFTPTWWEWDFGDGNTSTSQHPFHNYTSSGVYTVTLISGNALGSDTLTQTAYTNINLAIPPSTTDEYACFGDNVTLSASGSGNDLLWYNSATGGTSFNIGNSYSTTANSNTTYYVEEILSLGSFYGGPADNTTLGGGGMHTNDAWDLKFNCYSPTLLKTVDVYADVSFSTTVEILDASGAQIFSTPISVVSGLNTININFMIPTGNNYRIGVNGTNDGLYRNNSMTGYSWPIPVGNNIEVTGNTTTSGGGADNWYYFYNWEIEEYCTSNRAPVSIILHPHAPVQITTDFHNDICLGDTIIITASNGYSYSWNSGQSTQSISEIMSALGAFDYIVTGIDSNGCATSDTETINVIECGSDIFAANTPNIKIYPNPNNGTFAVTHESSTNEVQSIAIYNLQGKLITAKNTEYQDNVLLEEFKLDNISKGIYLIQINTERGSIHKKIVIQ